MPQIFKGNFSSRIEKIWAQIRQGAFDKTFNIQFYPYFAEIMTRPYDERKAGTDSPCLFSTHNYVFFRSMTLIPIPINTTPINVRMLIGYSNSLIEAP